MVSNLFSKLRKNPDFFLTSNKGKDFEERISQALIGLGYTTRIKSDFSKERFKVIKNWASHKSNEEYIDVEEIEKKQFIKQPFGSQDYPDLLVFSHKKIIPLEIKYSRQNQGCGLSRHSLKSKCHSTD